MALLIALPVTAMAGTTTILETVTPTPDRRAISRMGAADLLITPFSAAADEAMLRSLLPEGSRVEPVPDMVDNALVGGAEIGVSVRAFGLDGLAAGMLDLVSGRTPERPGEVAISPSIAAIAAIRVGNQLTLRSLGDMVVVGIVEDPMNLRAPIVLVDPVAEGLAGAGAASYLVELPDGVNIDMLDPALLGRGAAEARLPFAVTSRAQAAAPTATQAGAVFVLGGLALIEAALIASAAFAVSIRRRQRDLGLLGAAGGAPSHLRVTVLTEGACLGLVGALSGVALGVIAAGAAAPWLDQLTDRRNPPLVLLPHWLVLAALIGFAAALLAAVVPAWTCSRVPVLAALSGRRPVSAPARRTLRIGLATVGAGFAITLAGSLYRLQDAEGLVWAALLLAGAVLGVLGFGACSPWLLERLETLAPRLPLSARLALRDTARFRSRNGPIVTAVLAAFAATVAVAALLASQEARAAQYYQPMLRADQLMVVGDGARTAGPEIARELGALAAAHLTTTALVEEGSFVSVRVGGRAPEADDYFGGPAVGDEELLRALGGEEAIEEFRQGHLILFSDHEVTGPAVIEIFRETPAAGAPGIEVIGQVPYRTLGTEVPNGSVPSSIISPGSAQTLGITAVEETQYLIRLSHTATDQEMARAGEIAQRHPPTSVNVERGPERPGEAFRVLLLVASLAFALSITGVAVALGEAEARADQRVLLALGAGPSVRRRITAARAGVLSAIAGVLAVPAGLLPVWGLLFTAEAPIVLPLLEVLGALAVLPITAVLGAALLSRPMPAWSALRG
ncbi:MAG: FtsX-like permease family protein [Candidatus Limnocylindrales bacterium]